MRGAVLGLLRKAHTIRTSLGLPPDGRDEFAFDPDSGISEEDQKDVLRQIERVATQNRMDVRPEEFAVKAAKRGILFPVLVNLVAVIALVGGLGALYFFFQKGETQLSRARPAPSRRKASSSRLSRRSRRPGSWRRTSRSTRSRTACSRSTSSARTSRRTWIRRSRSGKVSSRLPWRPSWRRRRPGSRSRGCLKKTSTAAWQLWRLRGTRNPPGA